MLHLKVTAVGTDFSIKLVEIPVLSTGSTAAPRGGTYVVWLVVYWREIKQ